MMLIPLVTPEIVAGASGLLIFTQVGLDLSITTIILAHITFSISYVTVVVRARLAALGREVEDASMDLGATRWQTFRLVTLPALWPAVIAAGLLVFALSFDDFVLSFFTTGESPQPLPVRIWTQIRFGVRPTINAIGTFMLVISTLSDRARAAAAAPARARRERAGSANGKGGRVSERFVREESAEPSASAIRFEGVTKRFGDSVAVDDLNLEIREGRVLLAAGPSGCGKTTTLRMVAGFEQPSEGRIYLDGEPVETVPPYERNVNTVFQSYALFEHLNIADNVAFGLRRRKIAKDEIRDAREARRSSWWSCKGARSPVRASSPAARSSAWRWRGHWSTGRRCCCSTSRSARSTSSCASRCRSSSRASSARWRSPSST